MRGDLPTKRESFHALFQTLRSGEGKYNYTKNIQLSENNLHLSIVFKM